MERFFSISVLSFSRRVLVAKDCSSSNYSDTFHSTAIGMCYEDVDQHGFVVRKFEMAFVVGQEEPLRQTSIHSVDSKHIK